MEEHNENGESKKLSPFFSYKKENWGIDKGCFRGYNKGEDIYKKRERNMSLLHFFTAKNINQGVEEYRKNPDSILLDVRTEEEYADGHIRGSVNVPLQRIEGILEKVADPRKVIYVYCRSGVRSEKAVTILKQMGYANAIDIGGILAFRKKDEIE